MDWRDLDARYVWHPFTQMQTAPAPLPIARAEGAYLITDDGRRILDGISSWWVNIHGHAHPFLNAALAAQAQKMAQIIFGGCAHEPAARLAEQLVLRTPHGLNHVFYSDNGSTAVEVALKMAYQVWRNRGETKRTRFVALEHAYHGDTLGAMAVGGVPVFHRTYHDLMFDVIRIPASAETLETILENDPTIAAVILEPMVQGAGGMLMWPASFLADVRRITTEHDVLLIADEIFTGFGRTGRMFACEHANITPDIMCLSKALTAGYLPLSATLTTDDVYNAFLSDDRAKTFFHGHSFTANSLACAVALASLELFDSNQCLTRITELEKLFRTRLDAYDNRPSVKTTRNIGGIAVVEFHGQGYLDDIGPRLAEHFLKNNILLRPLGNVWYFLPPYVVTDDEVHRVFDVLDLIMHK